MKPWLGLLAGAILGATVIAFAPRVWVKGDPATKIGMATALRRGKQGAPALTAGVDGEQVLPVTLGGFLKDGPENEKLEGICGTDYTRNLLNCDIHNGLPRWTITEVTLVVTWAPYGDHEVRHFRVPVTIQPETAEHVTIRLGLQLPPDEVLRLPSGKGKTSPRWGWQIVGAKGHPAK